ncbi:MAG: signal peptidase I [Clostridiaceae bacterium]|nr:signal peptidase I [Clostridiaceae bacterium]
MPLRLKSSVRWWAINAGAIHVMVLFMAGLLLGFGKSPYNQTLRGILINILVTGTRLTGREISRDYIVNSLAKDEKYIVFIPVAVFMTLLDIPYFAIMNLKSIKKLIIYAAENIAPDFCQNILATYLAFAGGWTPSLIYMGIIQAFHWLSPILPDLKWIAAALIGILTPLFSLVVIQGISSRQTREAKRSPREKENPIRLMLTCICSIVLVWFSVGVFPVYPSVIATGSMEPVIKPGDMILVKKIRTKDEVHLLKEGDIIQFKRGEILISHRIKEVIEDKDQGLRFITKGDNNSSADLEPVTPENLKGKVIGIVPKIGWPALVIRQKDAITEQ